MGPELSLFRRLLWCMFGERDRETCLGHSRLSVHLIPQPPAPPTGVGNAFCLFLQCSGVWAEG